MAKLSYRRLFAWAVLCCTLTALCGLGRCIGLAVLVGGIFSVPLFAYWWLTQSARVLSLATIITRLLVMLLPSFTFIYAAYVVQSHDEVPSKKHSRRIDKSPWFNQNKQSTVSKYCGKRLVLYASIERILNQTDPPAQIVLANCSKVGFPQEGAVDGRACFVVTNPVVSSDSACKIAAGDSISVACYLRSGKFSSTKNSRVASETCSYLEQHKKNFDVFAFVRPQDVRVLPKPDDVALADIQPFIAFCRDQIFEAHERSMGTEKAALLTSMVLGQNAVDLPANIVQNFRNAGLSHIVAASGFNLTIVMLATCWILRPINLPNNLCEYACLAMIIFYVALAGLSISVARAAMMSFFILLSRVSQRRVRIGAVLAAALIVTWLPSPQSLMDVGLQFSYVATTGVIVAASAFHDLLNYRPNWISKRFAEAFTATIVAQLSVLPIQLYHFGTLGLTFLPANLLVVPLVGLITVAGFVGSLLILLGSLHPVIGF